MKVKRETVYSVVWEDDRRDMEISGPDGRGDFEISINGCVHDFSAQGLWSLGRAITTLSEAFVADDMDKPDGWHVGQE